MNIDARVITVALFLMAQAIGGVIYLSKLSSEVERIGNVQAASMEDTSGINLLEFKVDDIRDRFADEIEILRAMDETIMEQHERIFEWMASSSGRSSNPYE